MARPGKPASPFRCFNSSPGVIRLVVLMCVRYPLSLRNVEGLLFERGIDVRREMVRWPGGNRSWPEVLRAWGEVRQSETSCGQTDSTAIYNIDIIDFS
jgi:transposase-like protein